MVMNCYHFPKFSSHFTPNTSTIPSMDRFIKGGGGVQGFIRFHPHDKLFIPLRNILIPNFVVKQISSNVELSFSWHNFNFIHRR